MKEPATLDLKLTLDQINKILQILGNAPYVQSANQINLIQEQIAPQIRAIQVAEAKAFAETES